MSTTVSQQFEGSTIEEALASAVSVLGEDLEIVDAQRVRRRGLLGLRRRECFEVTASASPAVAPTGFDDVLRRMVERVDEAERSVGADLADADPAWWSNAQSAVPEAGRGGVEIDIGDQGRRWRPGSGRDNPGPGAAEPEMPLTSGPAASSAPGATATLVAEARDVLAAERSGLSASRPAQVPVAEAPEPAVVGPAPVVSSQPPVVAVAPALPVVAQDAPVWSREALLALDLPAALVGRVRCEELEGDLEWVGALATAISELLETAASMSGPCELTGHGAASVVHLLRGACDGFRLDSLIIDQRRVPATPLELALAVRSLLRAEQ